MPGPTHGTLGEPTLVLNRSWMAITTTTVRRALSLVFQDSAHIICPRTFEVHDFTSWLSLEVNGEPVHPHRPDAGEDAGGDRPPEL
jgi:hypothetical protein